MDQEFRRVNDEAAKRAARILKSGFDAEAFIVYSIACMNDAKVNPEKDGIPDSTVDESISDLLHSFVLYHKGDREQLPNVLNEIRQIISELYHTAEDHESRDKICEFVNGLDCFKQ